MAPEQEKLDRAIDDLRKARKLDDQNPDLRSKLALAYGRRGELFFREKKYEPAISDLNHALELDPEFSYGYFFLGWQS